MKGIDLTWLSRLLRPRPTFQIEDVEIHTAGTSYRNLAMPIDFVPVSGKHAVDCLNAFHKEHPQQHAFIMGTEDDLQSLLELYDERKPVSELLRTAEELTVPAWREAKANELAKLIEQNPDWGDLAEGPERGPWPNRSQTQAGIMHVRDPLSRNYHPEVIVGLSPAPSDRWWETAAHLNFGGWNDCPPAEVHVMLHRHWAEKYGASLVTMGWDVVELAISKPIRSKQEALAVAEIQYDYCNDVVDQGMGTLEALAASLIDAPNWFFWWD